MQPYYWRDGNNEMDFVIKSGSKIVGMEVKSSHEKYTHGLTLFREQFKPHAAFVVGYEGYPATDFLTADLRTLFD